MAETQIPASNACASTTFCILCKLFDTPRCNLVYGGSFGEAAVLRRQKEQLRIRFGGADRIVQLECSAVILLRSSSGSLAS